MVEIVSTYQGYGANKSYYLQLINRAHPMVFDETYRIGRRQNTFNAQKYYEEMVGQMIKLANADGREDIIHMIAN